MYPVEVSSFFVQILAKMAIKRLNHAKENKFIVFKNVTNGQVKTSIIVGSIICRNTYIKFDVTICAVLISNTSYSCHRGTSVLAVLARAAEHIFIAS